MRRRTRSVIGGVLALALAGCGGGGSSKASPSWDTAALAAARAKASEVAKRFPGQCADFSQLNRVTYVSSSKKIGSPVPLAAGQCSILDESIEISAFSDEKNRADFVAARGRILCARAVKAKTDLPGLRWVVGGKFAIQPDSEGVGRRLAAALGYTYQLTACRPTADWKPSDVAHAQQLAAALAAAGVGCRDFQLLDRDLLSHNPHYQKVGLPGAYGRCTIGSDPNVVIATFSNGTTPIGKFLPAELTDICTQSRASTAVRGPDWFVIEQKGGNGARLSALLHGQPAGGCTS